MKHLCLFRRRRSFTWWALAVGTWSLSILGITLAMARYATTAGQPSDISTNSAAHTNLPFDHRRATLIMCVLPQCPCSRASAIELEVLMDRCHEQVNAQVLFADDGQTNDLPSCELWKMCSRIENVKCVKDPFAKQCDALHAKTSGQVFLYDTKGVLRFSGGITAGRGHAGDNDGLSAIQDILNGKTSTLQTTPVYGCSLR